MAEEPRRRRRRRRSARPASPQRELTLAERVYRDLARGGSAPRAGLILDPAVAGKRSQSRDPFASGLLDNGFQGQLLPPFILLPETKQYMARRSPTVNTILMMRMNAIADFAHPPQFDGDTGFTIVPRDNPTHRLTSVEAREADRLRDFLLFTGVPQGRWARDSFRTALIKLFYNTFVFDAMPVELVRDETGRLVEWYVQDGGSIKRTDPRVYLPQTAIGKLVAPISYIQTVLDMVIAEWNAWEFIYGIRNASPVLNQNGYGLPELESLVEMVTVEIEAVTYAHRQLSQGSLPMGMLVIETQRSGNDFVPEISGEATGQGTEDFARAWRNELSGPENAGKMAYLKTEPGEKVQFFPTHPPSSMPFMQLLEVAHNTIAMTLGANPAEVPTIYGTMKEGFVQEGPKASDRRESHSAGLRRHLGAIGSTVLNPLIHRLNEDFDVQWVGIDTVQEHDRLNFETEMVKNGFKTLDELRVVRNDPPYDAWWSQIPLVPSIVQAEAQARGVAPAHPGPAGGPPGPAPDPRSVAAGVHGDDNRYA